MAVLGRPVPIETGEQILRARRTAAATRVPVGASGIALLLGWPGLVEHPTLAIIGFATILLSAPVQLAAPSIAMLSLEESVSASAGVLIVGLGPERADVVSMLWLVAVASGVLARGGRAAGFGRFVVLLALALPFVRTGTVEPGYVAMCIATLGLLLTSGRLTSELNLLLRQARLQADSAEALLLAGDIAARVAGRGHHEDELAARTAVPGSLTDEERAGARSALDGLVRGEGLEIVVQPIVDVRTGATHAYEALARFGEQWQGSSPLHWFELAERLGRRPALERACLREALLLLPARPSGTVLTVNVSAPVLVEAATLAMLDAAAGGDPLGLVGLVVEITEETLVGSEPQLHEAIEQLLALGMQLAVDDMGAGYSGLRQITTVRPHYLKLDRALICGIDTDAERTALVAALVGYASQVGSQLVAEGVETTAELRALQRIGVPLVQGFRLSRPGVPWPQAQMPDDEWGPREQEPGAGEWPDEHVGAELGRGSERRLTIV